MADVDVARVQQYKANVTLKFQQEGSLLGDVVRTESVKGKIAYFELIAPTAAIKRTVRHGLTPHTPSIHSRRAVVMDDYEWNDYIDDQDKIRMLINPESPYAQNGAWALGRTKDDLIYTAARGSALTGETGSGSQALPAAQKIAHGGVGLTLAKLLQGHRILGRAKVPTRERFFVVEPFGIEDLLNITQLTSMDYNSIRTLMTGEIQSFLGLRWVNYVFDAVGTDYFSIMGHKDSMGYAQGEDIVTRIDEIPERGYATQVYLRMTGGSVRVQDEGIVEIAYQ